MVSLGGKVGDVSVLVIRSPEDGETLVALDSTCPHAGCDVEWKQGDNMFACPCHGSKFQPDGAVANGPAESPLSALEAKIEADKVLVKAA